MRSVGQDEQFPHDGGYGNVGLFARCEAYIAFLAFNEKDKGIRGCPSGSRHSRSGNADFSLVSWNFCGLSECRSLLCFAQKDLSESPISFLREVWRSRAARAGEHVRVWRRGRMPTPGPTARRAPPFYYC
jgi:hypothetical protein